MFEFLQESVYENDMIFIENGISTIEDCRFAFESAETYGDVIVIQESLGSTVQSVFKRIADAFQKIIQALKNLFNKDKDDELAKKIKENPEAAKQKVKAADQKKLNKLYDDAVKKVKNGEDPEKVQSWFKKNAKAIATTAVITVSAAALLLVQNKNHKEALAKVESRAKEAETRAKEAEKWWARREDQLSIERDTHNREINKLNSQHSAEINSMQAKHEADLAKLANRKNAQIKQKDAKAKETAVKEQTALLVISKEYQKSTEEINHNNEKLINDVIKDVDTPANAPSTSKSKSDKAKKRMESRANANQYFRNGGNNGGGMSSSGRAGRRMQARANSNKYFRNGGNRGDRATYSSAHDFIFGSEYFEDSYDEEYYDEFSTDYDYDYDDYDDYM